MTQTQKKRKRRAPRVRRSHHPAPLGQMGQWELVELAAQGSLSNLYRARPLATPGDRPPAYAIKTLRKEWEDSPEAIEMLRREAFVGRCVSHPHVISVLQASVRRSPPFLVMPWLEGVTLAERLTNNEQFDLPTTLWIARQVAEGLGALRQAGWTHGDVKPSNLLLAPNGHVTLLDLGFARREDETGSAIDRCVTGTYRYLAPETITSTLRTDIRSDIYALGVVLFEMLRGRVPFDGPDLAALAGQHRQAVPEDLRNMVFGFPDDISALVRRMLAKDPLRRPQTPHELTDHLRRLEIASFTQRSVGLPI